MTLEFEKLTADLEQMAQTTARRAQLRQERLREARQALEQYRTNWAAMQQALARADSEADPKFYRSARPLDETTPLDAAIPAPEPPSEATVIATDGSQIMPDRHASYLYYLINIGGIIYHHGSSRQPSTFTYPDIIYPQSDEEIDSFNTSQADVSIERDVKEIEGLARTTIGHRHEAQPLLAILDQRLLYRPIGSAGFAVNTAVSEWNEHMTAMRQAGALLCGYIDRPETISVMTLLRSTTALSEQDFNWRVLGKRQATQGITDRQLFQQLLAPGQRSKIFVYVSEPNNEAAAQDPANEVCFFYLNSSLSGSQIARVDIPLWVAEDEAAVTAVHGLVVHQCRLLGDYPYVLARADEMAVVGRQDAGELNYMIDVIMERHGIMADVTAKQGSKEIARGGRTRFGM